MRKIFSNIWQKVRSFNYKGALSTFWQDAIVFPLHIISHPIQGWEEFKFEKKGKMYVAVFYLLMMVLVQSLNITASGFLINGNNTNDFNLVLTALLVIVPVIAIAVGNWSITALMDGKGKLKEIFMLICYALMPYVLLGIPLIIISNFLVQSELGFYNAMFTLGTILLIYMAFTGILVIHEYGLAKTIVTIILTVVAVAVIIFILLLLLTLFQTVSAFVKSVYEELILRLS